MSTLLLTSLASYLIFEQVIVDRIGLSRVSVLQQIAERTRVIKNAAVTISNLYESDVCIRAEMTAPNLNESSMDSLRRTLIQSNAKYQEAFEQANLSFYTVFIADNGFRFCSLKEHSCKP